MHSKYTGYDSAYVKAARNWEASIANAEQRRQSLFAKNHQPLSPTTPNHTSSNSLDLCNRLGPLRISHSSNPLPGMTSRLGLGSRANSLKRPTEQRSQRQPIPFASSISANTTPRRGFGLFDDDLDDDSEGGVEMRDPPVAVKFSGDTSGFAALRSYRAESSGDEMTPRRAGGSRKSQHTTPSRPKSARPSRRQTPYNSTTSRALQRARRESKGERDDDRLIFESLEQETTTSDGTRKRETKKKAEFTLSTNVDNSDDDQPQENEPLLEKNTATPEAQNKTWGQWLKSILPKPLATVLKPKDPYPRTPEQAEQALLEIPGSYDRVSVNEQTPVLSYSPLVQTPIPNPNGLFSYPADVASPQSSTPDNHRRRLTYTPHKDSHGRSVSASPSVSLRKPSNFIERMRTTRGTRRYDPYARASRSVTPQRSPPAKSPEEMTPEEHLELLERRKRDRKVQEAEDRYLKRAVVKALGRNDISSSEDEVDEGVQTSPIKPSRSYDEDQEMTSTTPPTSPPKTPSFSFSVASPPKFEPSSAPIFNDVESDKENAPSAQPPPPPSPSHRQLPDIHNATPPPPVPPGVGLFEPVNRQRAVLEKHKPRVSSSLRNEATQQKENAVASSSSSSTMTGGLFGKAGSEKQLVPAPSTTASSSSSMGALREVESNQLVGQGMKVDVRAKIAALPVKDLAALISWPALDVLGSKDIREKVAGCWSAEEPAAMEVARAVAV